MSGLQWTGQRWLVYRGTPEQPGRLYWACTHEEKARQMVQDLAKLGIAAFYVAPEPTSTPSHAAGDQSMSKRN